MATPIEAAMVMTVVLVSVGNTLLITMVMTLAMSSLLLSGSGN